MPRTGEYVEKMVLKDGAQEPLLVGVNNCRAVARTGFIEPSLAP
ncbi:hypothetical protein D3OALGA1CA_733 [Olavius algarvensis associated proteobacterium Delta 3]|nr:hypothetical protein D3OALGB2SA_56 [Olavius algarvensis associated proteobacterium Delta 3]CAB5088366.1 hypothetical protein D3OALGA1CA_733 [Olavius algarvensis associated proteobacterium Delta 3]